MRLREWVVSGLMVLAVAGCGQPAETIADGGAAPSAGSGEATNGTVHGASSASASTAATASQTSERGCVTGGATMVLTPQPPAQHVCLRVGASVTIVLPYDQAGIWQQPVSDHPEIATARLAETVTTSAAGSPVTITAAKPGTASVTTQTLPRSDPHGPLSHSWQAVVEVRP